MRSILSGFFLVLILITPASAALQSAAVTEMTGNAYRGNVKAPVEETSVQTKATLDPLQYIRTGAASRVELQFNDKTIARLGANSIFHFSSDRTNLVLEKGEGLFVIPKGLGGATISTPSLSAAILGTSVYVKMSPRAVEYYCLEGKCRIGPHTLSPGEALILPGKMAAYGAAKSTFNIAGFMKSTPLVTDFKEPLPSRALIEAEAKKQP